MGFWDYAKKTGRYFGVGEKGLGKFGQQAGNLGLNRYLGQGIKEAPKQLFSRQGLGSYQGVKAVGKGVYSGAVDPLLELGIRGVANKGNIFKDPTNQTARNLINIVRKPMEYDPRASDTQRDIQAGFGFAGMVVPYSAAENLLAKGALKIPVISKALANSGKVGKIANFGMRRLADIGAGQILGSPDEINGQRLKQSGQDLVAGSLFEGAGVLGKTVTKAAKSKTRTAKIAKLMDAKVKPIQYKIGNVTVNEPRSVRTQTVSNAEFEFSVKNKRKPKPNEIINDYTTRGNTTLQLDEKGGILSWTTDNPLFAKKMQDQGGYGMSTRTVKPSEEKLYRGTEKNAPLQAVDNINAKSNTQPTSGIDLNKKKLPIDPEAARTQVQQNIQSKFDDFERMMYGTATSELQGGNKGAGFFSGITRPIQEKTSGLVAKGLSSQNRAARSIARGIRGLFGGSGTSAEQAIRQGKFKGGIQEATNLANDFMDLGSGLTKESKDRIHAILDPEISKLSINESQLTPDEKNALEILRQASDLINDTNFAQGKISYDTWKKGRGGKYITRAYEPIDLPPELSDAFSGGKGKQDLGAYKQRQAVDDWKQENAITDPFYLASKRIQSTFQNKHIADYGSWIAKQPDMISTTVRKGYTQLSDSPVWGDLSGKWVRQDVLEGIKGFYSDTKWVQGFYDMINAYDKNVVRQFLKKTKTIFNPATRLGNQIGNRSFAILNGINNYPKYEYLMNTFAKSELKNNGQFARFLRQNGVLGNDMTKYELVKQLADDGADAGTLKRANDYIIKTYGNADDHAKIAAFKYWIDAGKTKEEALLKVKNGFQDYSKVGLYYDIAAKLPIIGKPFVRFQSELLRIIKNAAMENPLGLATIIGTISLIGDISSIWSGESPEDKQVRENRLGVPKIPFTNIPLSFQTPYGEVNAARLYGMFNYTQFAGNNTTNQISKYLPIDLPTNKDDALKMMGNDVMLGGLISLVTDTDFRGKSIADPDQNKYQPSTLTPQEQWINRTKYLGRNYNLPFVNDLIDTGSSLMGKEDFYGRKKTPAQAIAKLGGIKIEQFGPEEAQKQREKNEQFAEYKQESIDKQVNQVIKDQLQGKISQEVADKRIANLNKQPKEQGIKTASANSNIKEYNGRFHIVVNGKRQSFDTKEEATLAIEKDKLPKKKGSSKVVGTDLIFYNPKTKKNEKESFETEEEAKIAEGKYQFKQSGEDIGEYGDYVFTKNKKGDVTTYTKSEFKYKVRKQQLEIYRENDNYGEWSKLANEQLNYLKSEYENADPLKQLELQNEIINLENSISKYSGYGGKFKKDKELKLKDKKLKLIRKSLSPINVPKIPRASSGSYKVRKISLK